MKPHPLLSPDRPRRSERELIVYDDTPAPEPGAIEAWAAALGLPPAHWTVVRRLLGRVVAVGGREAANPEWVLRGGRGGPHPGHFARAAVNAGLLARFAAAHPAELLAPDPGLVRLGDWSGVSLLATPYLSGRSLAPERKLSAGECIALGAEIPALVRLVTQMAAFTPLVPAGPFLRGPYISRCVARVESRLARLVEVDGLEPVQASRIGRDFARSLEAATLRPTFCHGELTGWHVLRRSDGRLCLIDLETMGTRDPQHLDDSVFVMRTWALNGAPAIAQAFLAARRASLPGPERAVYDAELAWHWPYAALRTRIESLAWPDRTAVRSFWTWAFARSES